MQNAVSNTKLKQVTNASARLEVWWEVRDELPVEDAHLVTGRVRYDHLCYMTKVPVIQLFHHPVRNVVGVVALGKGGTA